jgi:hypothetical protein
MRRPVRVKTVFFLLSLPWSQAASVAILPSALFRSDFSLGASWAFSFQQVLQPDNRPLLPTAVGKLVWELAAVT